MKKKIICGLLTAVMILSMGSVNAFADESYTSLDSFNVDGENTATIGGYYSVNRGANMDNTVPDYYVMVSWTSTPGDATLRGNLYRWDASEKKYVVSNDVVNQVTKNDPAEVEITITNQSNYPVEYEISYDSANGYDTTEYPNKDASNIFDSKIGEVARYETGVVDEEAKTADAPSSKYKGYVTLNNLATEITNDAVGTYTVNVTAKKATYTLTGENAGSTVLSSTDMFATGADSVEYESNGTTCIAYNGYIKKTNGATWDDAKAFIAALNDSGIIPSGRTAGSWRLLYIATKDDGTVNDADAIAWAMASGAKIGDINKDASTGVYYPMSDYDFNQADTLWSEQVNDGTLAYSWFCIDGRWAYSVKADSNNYVGFVVIWEDSK